MTKSKLVVRLATEGLKFTDFAINKHQSIFTNRKRTVVTKIVNSGLKGLKLSQSKLTNRKYFIQNFWFNGMSHWWSVGEFRLGVYGINECRNEVNEIMKSHCNSEGLWTRNPKITKRHKNERVKKAEILNRQMKTVRECIVELCKSNFPKIKKEGTLTGQTIRKFCLPLIGYNKRTQHLVYDDDEFGNGYITFKANRKFHTNKPESWDDLFTKFPPGYGCITKINGREVKDKSLYDSEIGKMLIEDLTPAIVRNYLETTSKGWATKRTIIDAFQILWSNSRKYMGDDKPLNPTTREALEVKNFEVSKGKNSKYNRRKFPPKALEKIWVSLQKISGMGKHPFLHHCLSLTRESPLHV